MRTRIYNARIITMANGTDILEGEIHIENERIAFVGAGEDAKNLLKIQIQCLTGRLMLMAM